MEDQLNKLKRQDDGIVDESKRVLAPSIAMTDTGLKPRSIEEAWRFAQFLAASQFVPEIYRGKAGDCLVAIDMAARLNVAALMLLQNTYVVHGKPGMEAKFVIALVNASGLFTDPLEYEIDGDDPRDKKYRVRAFATRKETGKTIYGPWITWDIVIAEGWDKDKETRKGGIQKSKWNTMPGLMFIYRAASWFSRVHCAEVTMGMLTTDELDEIEPRKEVDAKVIEGKPRGKFGFSQKEDEQAEDQTPPETQDPVDPPADDDSDIDPGDETDNLPADEPPVEEEETYVFHCNECEANFNDATRKKYKGKLTNFCKCGSRNLDSWEDWKKRNPEPTEPEETVGGVWMCENGHDFREPVNGACPVEGCGSKSIEQLEPAEA